MQELFVEEKGKKTEIKELTYDVKNSEFSLTPEQIKKLILACDNPRDRLIIKILAYTGMRVGELCNLRIEDIFFYEGKPFLKVYGKGRNKTKRVRYVPISLDLYQEIKFLINGRSEGYIFLSKNGKKFQRQYVQYLLDKLSKKTGIKNPNPRRKHLSPHVFRHSFVRNLRRLGVPDWKIRKITGHSQKVMDDIYGSAEMRDLLDVLKVVEGLG